MVELRNPKRALVVLGVTCGVLAVVAACGYVFWGWMAVFASPLGYVPAMHHKPWGPADFARAREEAARYGSWALAFRYAGFTFGGVALGCAAVAGWRERREWRKWPWPSLVCFVPGLCAFAISLVAGASNAVVVIALAVEVVCVFAAFFDLARIPRGSPSRALSWTVLATGLLAILIRPLLPWH